MNEEIKKILDYLNKFINDKEEITKYGCEISVKEAKLLLDYITNLKQIEQHYSQILSENAELEQEIDEYKGIIKALKNNRPYIAPYHEDQFITFEMEYFERKKLKKENETLRIDISARETVCDDYKSRIDKAIEYIEQLEHNEWIMVGRKILLDILKGD